MYRVMPPNHRMKYWEIIADNLRKAGWSWGCVSALDSEGRTIWIADAYRDDGKRFIVHADEKLTAFLELESATRTCSDSCLTNKLDSFKTLRRSGLNPRCGKVSFSLNVTRFRSAR